MTQLAMNDDPSLSMISALSEDSFNIEDSSENHGGSPMEWITDDNESSALPPNQCRFVRPPIMPKRLKSITCNSAAALDVSPPPRAAAKNRMNSPTLLVVEPQRWENTTSYAISLTPLQGSQRMESSSTACSISTRPLLIPHRLHRKDCLFLGVSPLSPPNKNPQRLQPVEDTTTSTLAPPSLAYSSEQSSEESIPVHDVNPPPSIPQRRGSLFV